MMRTSFAHGLLASSWASIALAHGAHTTQDHGKEYDYIVVGGGPSGIITAERLAEAKKSVLLLERGTGPTVATGSNDTLSWNNTLTEIDLPGLSFDIGNLDVWNDYMCTDTGGTAACVLGGGVTVNYMVFVHPPAHDFDDRWPKGWKWRDVESAADRLYSRNPGSLLPSADGKRYDQGVYTLLSGFFSKLGWSSVDMSAQPNEKHQVYSHPAWNIKDQKRAGPIRTYLPLAEAHDNFSIRLGTKVTRLVRDGRRVVGVEAQTGGGQTERIRLAPKGRVILAAGALSTPRILFNSGIGPASQIETANKSGIAVPPRHEWINLPVGVGVKDHPIFSIIVKTNGTFAPLDGPAILNGSAGDEIQAYEDESSGVLTQGKHRMIFFTSNVASDNQTRYYQGSCAPTADGVVTITSYMTHGLTSSGVLGLDANQNTVMEQSPYLQTAGDQEAAEMFINQMISDITAPGTGLELHTYTNTSAIIGSLTGGVHYTSTTKMGLDDGRFNGTAVVDTDAKVYGMDNLFIVDGGIHPDLPTGNIQATVMVVAEAAVHRILATK
ncbi:hypothetical protein P175DRAFT_0554501 [Aspergillus ochraceoroseus IBT 24754]|uniref:Glucose-methanol-choline oxidoreductase N-terminal domain-containing protein n=2 Tax=Aspergillus ochraceoroseus TaxID=138278 RepID=A0A2T5M9P3_9EURO|nr:uncharacterized protein P175DRAFT_0554501 [Aspergillus ochraceoroseus IBT 24754]KKK11834.1 hypothetical protein AOCH_003740 [Aspergillus ochraceoroseus]PTU25253.1 hypothetical protein P175DRAFT_0554501 [Aspergillus ochraceoroseus IBT 24754]